MTPIHPVIQRAFTLCRRAQEPEDPPAFLEERVTAAWRNLPPAADPLNAHRLALACACAAAAISLAVSYSVLAPAPDPAVAVANAALHNRLLR